MKCPIIFKMWKLKVKKEKSKFMALKSSSMTWMNEKRKKKIQRMLAKILMDHNFKISSSN